MLYSEIICMLNLVVHIVTTGLYMATDNCRSTIVSILLHGTMVVSVALYNQQKKWSNTVDLLDCLGLANPVFLLGASRNRAKKPLRK